MAEPTKKKQERKTALVAEDVRYTHQTYLKDKLQIQIMYVILQIVCLRFQRKRVHAGNRPL